MSTNKKDLKKYLNDVKTKVSKDIELVENEIECSEYEIGDLKKSSLETNQKICDAQKRIKEIEEEIKTCEPSLISTLISERRDLECQIKNNDEKVDYAGDIKTRQEKLRLDLSSYKLKCKELIETIDLNLEEPDDEASLKKEIQDAINNLYKLFKQFKNDLSESDDSSLKDLVS